MLLLDLKLFLCDGPLIEGILYFVNTNYYFHGYTVHKATNYYFSLCISISYCLFIFLRCNIPVVLYNTQ